MSTVTGHAPVACRRLVAVGRADGSGVRTPARLLIMELVAATVSDAWRSVLDLFQRPGPTRIATRHGISFDIPALTVVVERPEDLSVPPDYLYPELISDYRERLFGDQREQSLFYQRLRGWRSTGDASPIDQLAGIRDLLTEDPHSRSAVFSTWDPAGDLGGDFPVSPVGGCVRLVGGTLLLILSARSVDVWVGLVPELLTFAQIASTLAPELGVTASRIVYQAWSAHLYEIDYLSCTSE